MKDKEKIRELLALSAKYANIQKRREKQVAALNELSAKIAKRIDRLSESCKLMYREELDRILKRISE